MDSTLLLRQASINVEHAFGDYDGSGGKYLLNIGYADGLLASGATVKAYLYGVKYPTKRFCGIVIAVGTGKSSGTFVVVAPKKTVAYDVNILPLINKYEKSSKILYAYEKSCGALIYKESEKGNKYLIVRQRLSNSWSFPKGHIKFGESEQQTASREIFEEVGINVDFIPGFRVEQFYHIKANIIKKVVMFLSCTSSDISIDNNEIISYEWVDESNILDFLNKKDAQALLHKADAFIFDTQLNTKK